jgi:hypothetical protein
VIFAAAAVMVAVFFTFALSGPLPPKEMGVILGIAVLLDAMLVRPMLELWRTEWCPASHRVREHLTELGVDYLTRQVPVEKDARAALRDGLGTAGPIGLRDSRYARPRARSICP